MNTTLKSEARAAILELIGIAGLTRGSILVIGGSTSEIIGKKNRHKLGARGGKRGLFRPVRCRV